MHQLDLHPYQCVERWFFFSYIFSGKKSMHNQTFKILSLVPHICYLGAMYLSMYIVNVPIVFSRWINAYTYIVVRYRSLDTWIYLGRFYPPRFYQPRYNLGRFYLRRYYPSWFYPGSIFQKRILVIYSILFWVSEPG